ncbi:hypothetical protein ACFL6S_07210 [Candidatus Poribacteria bacterium]
MSIISLNSRGIKASESYDDTNIDDTATELLTFVYFCMLLYVFLGL